MDAKNFELKNLAAQRLAVVRHTGPYNTIGPAFRQLAETADPAGLFLPGAMMVGVYQDDPTIVAAEKLRSAAGITIGDDVAMPDGLVEERIEAGAFVSITHTGSYAGLPDAWQRAIEAVRASGRKRRSAASYEIYVNDSTQVPEAELKTEIYIPVE